MAINEEILKNKWIERNIVDKQKLLTITSDDVLYNSFFTDEIKLDLEKEKQIWIYDKDKFHLGAYNVHPSKSLIKLICDALYNKNKLMTLDECIKLITINNISILNLENYCKANYIPFTSDLERSILIGRIYQTRTGFLRELDAGKKILTKKPYINIYKNIILDLNYCVDLKLIVNKNIYFIAIEHCGYKSEYHEHKRKKQKREIFENLTGQKVIRLIASCTNKYTLDLISEHSINELLQKIDDNTFNQLYPNYIL